MFRRGIAYLDQAMRRSLCHSEHQIVAIGAMAFMGPPLFYWLWMEIFPQPYETLELRVIGSMLGLGLVLAPKWPAQFKPYLPWFWFATILYNLALFPAYYLLKSNATVMAAMSMLACVFLLVLLVDVVSLVFMVLIGWGVAFLGYYLTTKAIHLHGFYLQYFIIYLFTIITGSVFNYKTAMLQQQRLAGMAAAASMIAHELRTPLLSINSAACALNQYVPNLVKTYQLALELDLDVKKIRASRLMALMPASKRIMSEIHYANTIIDMLLVKSGREHTLKTVVLNECRMAECIRQALMRYPFPSSKEKNLVRWQGDFSFMGSDLLMEHVLFNLLKNALYFIATTQKGSITLWTSETAKWHCLHFKDTAKGISDKERSRLFNNFYTTTFQGTGIGLSFCKMVLQRFGGDIECLNKQGHYTEFVLYFPKICYAYKESSSAIENA